MFKLNPVTHEITLLMKPWEHGQYPLQVWDKRGRLLHTKLLGQPGYDAEFSEITEYIQQSHPSNLVMRHADGTRLFRFDGPNPTVLDEYDAKTLKRLSTSVGASPEWMNPFAFQSQYSNSPLGGIRVPSDTSIFLPGRWPAMRPLKLTTLPGMILFSGSEHKCHWSGSYLMAYKPAAKGDKNWAKNDQWIGPFLSPDGKDITGMVGWGDDKWVITTRRGMYITRVDRMMGQAASRKVMLSTQRWRDSYAKGLGKRNWRRTVILHLGNRDWKRAETVLSAVKDPKDQLHRMLWESYSLGRQEKYTEAEALYQKAIAQAKKEEDRCAEAYATVMGIICLYRGGMIEEAEKTLAAAVQRFPQLRPTKWHTLYSLAEQMKAKAQRRIGPNRYLNHRYLNR